MKTLLGFYFWTPVLSTPATQGHLDGLRRLGDWWQLWLGLTLYSEMKTKSTTSVKMPFAQMSTVSEDLRGTSVKRQIKAEVELDS